MSRKKMLASSVHKNEGIILSGKASFSARNVLVGDEGSIVDKSVSGEQKDDVLRLIASVETLTRQLPEELAKTRTNIEAFVGVLKQEAQKPTPNKSLWNVTSNGLIEASKAVASVAPELLQAAKGIADFFV